MKTLKLSIESRIDLIKMICKAFRGACSTIITDTELLYQLELCLSEVVTNIIEHTYHKEPGHNIDVIVDLDETELSLKVVDDGDDAPIHQPETVQEFTMEDIPTLRESGRGILLINQIMDTVSKTHTCQGNVMTLIKHLT